MPAWLFGLAITLLVGAAATAYLWLIRRRDDETAAGLLALAGMRWRDFSRLVLEAMQLRGLERITVAQEDAQEHSASFLLQGNGKRLLLACKHGSAYRIGSAAVDELASEVRLRGTQGAILVTEGVLDKGGREKAEKHNIEVVDGPHLWPAVKPMVEGNLQKRIVGAASARAVRHIGIAWLGAITLGLASVIALPVAIRPATQETPPPPTTVLSAVNNPVAPTTSTTAAPRATALVPANDADLEKNRAEVSRKLASTPGISRGFWISRSTLSVDRIVGEEAAWPLVCEQLRRYPDLALTRVQMNPPPGSSDSVHWRQCEML